VGQRRIGGYDLGARDDDASVRLLLYRDANVFDLFHRLVAVYRWIDKSVVEIEHRFLCPLVPGACVVRELAIELRIGAERVEKRGLVVRTATHPAIRNTGPRRDGVALRNDILTRAGSFKKLVRVAARSSVGRRGEHVLGFRIMQCVI
jgi:hypothetical protein